MRDTDTTPARNRLTRRSTARTTLSPRRAVVLLFVALIVGMAVAPAAALADAAGASSMQPTFSGSLRSALFGRLSAPTVTTPTLTTTVSKSGTFTVRWSDATVPAGPFDVDYIESGGTKWLHFKLATTATSAVFKGVAGRTYRFRAAIDTSGTPGEWSAEALATVPFDQKDFTFTSGWKSATSSTAFGGSTKYASTKGRSATFAFTGDSLTLVAPKGPAKGKLTVYLTDKVAGAWAPFVKVKTIDLYARTNQARRAFAIKTWDTVGDHQARLVVAGTKNRKSKGTRIDLDGLAVRNDPVPLDPIVVHVSQASPAAYTDETCQFTVTVDGTPVQDVTWQVYRRDRFATWFTDDVGTMSMTGLWTAPHTPTIDFADTADLDTCRWYIVTATSVADPTALWGTASPHVEIRPPTVTKVTPTSAPEGGTITLTGKYFGTDQSEAEVVFDGRPGTITSFSDTSISATVYSGWGGWRDTQYCYVWVRKRSVNSNATPFNVTNILCDPPDPATTVNWGYPAGSVGDIVEMEGQGFDQIAAHNLVRFNETVTPALTWEDDPYDGGDWGTITVAVPAGATTGPLSVRRSDGKNEWATSCTFTVRPAFAPTLTGLADGPGIVDLDCHDAAAGNPALDAFIGRDSFVFTGTGFSKLTNERYSTPLNCYVDLTVGSQTWRLIGKAIDDTRVVANWDIFAPVGPAAFYAALQPGGTFKAQVVGIEHGTWYERRSTLLTVPVSDGMVLGRARTLALPLAWSSVTIAEDSLVVFTRADDQPVHQISAPGLWSGTQSFGSSYVNGKVVVCDEPGSYTITDVTAGTSATLVVAEAGPAAAVSQTSATMAAKGITLAYGGARLKIPAGALPPVTESDPAATAYTVSASCEASTATYRDPVKSDFGYRFHVTITPEPKRLIKALTVTIPYDPAGRTSPPELGLADDSSGIPYPLDATLDDVEHTLTLTLPAGTYAPPPQAAPAPREVSAGTGVAPRQQVPAAHVNVVLDDNAVFSYNQVVGYLTDATRALEVEWIRNPAHPSYVDDTYGAAVMAAAQTAYDNLVTRGWAKPTGWFDTEVTIKICDLGPNPSGTMGGTTTAGVFGQPWVAINKQSAVGPQLNTAVAHEMCHVFQRQYTTNIILQWIDEATADWNAVSTLGTGADVTSGINSGPEFASLGIPNDFDSMDTTWETENAYAAGAFIDFLADHYGQGDVVKIYQKLYYSPSWWGAAWATLEYAFGHTMEDMVMEFSQAYWTQNYYPLTPDNVSLSPMKDKREITGWPGLTINDPRPAMSSERYTITAETTFKPQILNNDTVIRVDALAPNQRVYVYGDTGIPGQRPDYTKLTQLTYLYDGRLSANLGPFNGNGYQCYRVVVINASRAAATPSVCIVAPHISSTNPGTVKNDGGQSLTVLGTGFGATQGTQGRVRIMGVDCAVTSWSVGAITVTTPNLGTYVGNPDVKVTTAEGAVTNGQVIAVVD